MKCAQAQKLIKPYLDHTLPDHELSQFLEHIKGCRDCYEDLEIYLAISETLKNDDERSDPEDFDFHAKLQRELENSENKLRIIRSQAWIARGVLVAAVFIIGLLVYTGLQQRRNPDLPAWETEMETPSEEPESGESVMEAVMTEAHEESISETVMTEESTQALTEAVTTEESKPKKE